MFKSRIAKYAGTVVLSAVVLTGCGEEEKKPTPVAVNPSAVQAGPALPTVDTLNQILADASNPEVPVEQKMMLVESGTDAPELFDQIAKVKSEKQADIVINNVLEGDFPNTAIANAVLKQAGQKDTTLQASFIFEDGQWKIERAYACSLIRAAGLTTPLSCNS